VAVAATSTARRGPRAQAFALAALTLVLVAAVDQGTKALALASLTPGDGVNVFYGIDLNLVRNTGIAFGVLAGAGDGPIVAFTALALGALLVFFWLRAGRPLLWLPVGMVLGGAAGNLIDRARFGAVVDFIDPVLWPAFNLADLAIVLGVLGVLYVAESPSSAEGGRETTARAAKERGGSVGP
jgi:signal peptidase II